MRKIFAIIFIAWMLCVNSAAHFLHSDDIFEFNEFSIEHSIHSSYYDVADHEDFQCSRKNRLYNSGYCLVCLFLGQYSIYQSETETRINSEKCISIPWMKYRFVLTSSSIATILIPRAPPISPIA